MNLYKQHQIEDEPNKIYLVSEDTSQKSLDTNIICYVRFNDKWHISSNTLSDEDHDSLEDTENITYLQNIKKLYRTYYTRTNLNIQIPGNSLSLKPNEKKQITNDIMDIKVSLSLKIVSDILGLLLVIYRMNNVKFMYKNIPVVFMTNLEKHLIYK
jgi:hypothetical protein